MRKTDNDVSQLLKMNKKNILKGMDMKYLIVVFILIVLTGMLLAQDAQVNADKKQASFAEQGKNIEATGTSVQVEKNAAGYIKVQQNGNQVSRKSKEREGMGSASTSGPAEEIMKINAKPTTSIQEVVKSLDNGGETKRRAEK